MKVREDNDALIHMCIKARAPKLRHLARTLRIDLDWLSERFTENPVISITYINSKVQLADIFSKAAFTAFQWDKLLHLIQTSENRTTFNHGTCGRIFDSQRSITSSVVMFV